MRRLLAVVAALAAAATLVLQADAARRPTPAETQAIAKVLDAYWCHYLPRADRPCADWRVTVSVRHVSTVVRGWALAQLDARGPHPATLTFTPFQNVFLRQGADGTWRMKGWFGSLVYPSCRAAAKGTKVPEKVLREFGLCDHLTFTIG
jgi:hypothetical protein